LLLGKLWKYRAGLCGLLIVLGMCAVAVGAGLISPHDPYDQEVAGRLKPPVWMERGSSAHILGTDPVGRGRVEAAQAAAQLVGQNLQCLSALPLFDGLPDAENGRQPMGEEGCGLAVEEKSTALPIASSSSSETPMV
jgi:hypothetical protein